jgi:capsule polysaccharide export protein KpsE/RkpR
MATEEEVAEAKVKVAKLRADLQSVRLGRGRENLADATNDIHLAELAAEAVALQAEIDRLKSGTTKTAAQQGAAAPLSAAKESMARAVAAAKSDKPAKAASSASAASTEGSDK